MARISIPEDLEAWAKGEVAAGRAESVEALVVSVLEERRDAESFVRARLEEARASLARGEGAPLDAVLGELDAWIAEDEADGDNLRPHA
jgi:Arc/MetJ-type ribon-helix-helix transcriptional regulator